MQEQEIVKSDFTGWAVNIALVVFGTAFIVWLGSHSWREQSELIERYGQGIAALIECVFIVLCAFPSRRIIIWWMECRSISRLLVMIIAFALMGAAIVYLTSLTSWIASTSSDGLRRYMLLLESA
jgi:hypothetical protein